MSAGRSRRPTAGSASANGPVPKAGLDFVEPEHFLDEVKAAQANPGVISLAVFLSAAAQHLHMKPFTLASLEQAVAYPADNELMCIILSRLLIRDKQLRDKLAKDEGMDPAWCYSFVRQTVRALFMRRQHLASNVDALAAACRETDDAALIGTSTRDKQVVEETLEFCEDTAELAAIKDQVKATILKNRKLAEASAAAAAAALASIDTPKEEAPKEEVAEPVAGKKRTATEAAVLPVAEEAAPPASVIVDDNQGSRRSSRTASVMASIRMTARDEPEEDGRKSKSSKRRRVEELQGEEDEASTSEVEASRKGSRKKKGSDEETDELGQVLSKAPKEVLRVASVDDLHFDTFVDDNWLPALEFSSAVPALHDYTSDKDLLQRLQEQAAQDAEFAAKIGSAYIDKRKLAKRAAELSENPEGGEAAVSGEPSTTIRQTGIEDAPTIETGTELAAPVAPETAVPALPESSVVNDPIPEAAVEELADDADGGIVDAEEDAGADYIDEPFVPGKRGKKGRKRRRTQTSELQAIANQLVGSSGSGFAALPPRRHTGGGDIVSPSAFDYTVVNRRKAPPPVVVVKPEVILAPVEASADLGLQLSNAAVRATSRAEWDAERERVARLSAHKITNTRQTSRNAPVPFDAPLTTDELAYGIFRGACEDEDVIDAVMEASSEADEDDVREFFELDAHLQEMAGSSTEDPLAHRHWLELSAEERVKLLLGLISIRLDTDGDDLNEFFHSSKLDCALTQLDHCLEDGHGNRYFCFPEESFLSEPAPPQANDTDESAIPLQRWYVEQRVQLRSSGRTESRWRLLFETVGQCKRVLTWLERGSNVFDCVLERERGNDTLSRSKSSAPPQSAADKALVAKFKDVLAGASDAAARAAARAEREAKREEKKQSSAAAPRRLSSRAGYSGKVKGADGDADGNGEGTEGNEDQIDEIEEADEYVESSAFDTAPTARGPVVVYNPGVRQSAQLLSMDRDRAINLLDRMYHADKSRAINDLIIIQPEHLRYVGFSPLVDPYQRFVNEASKEIIKKTFADEMVVRKRRMQRAGKDRNRAQREREAAEQREAERRREEERRRESQKELEAIREARAKRRELGIAATAIPSFVNPDLYLPSFIQLRLKVLHRPGFASYDSPLSFHPGKTDKTYAFLAETLAYEDMLDAKKRQDYLSPKVVVERFHPPPAVHVQASTSHALGVTQPRPHPHSQLLHGQQYAAAPQHHQLPQQSFPKAFISSTTTAPQLSQHLAPPVAQHAAPPVVQHIPRPIPTQITQPGPQPFAQPATQQVAQPSMNVAPTHPVPITPQVAQAPAPFVAQPAMQPPVTDALAALAESAAMLPTESVEVAPITGNGMST